MGNAGWVLVGVLAAAIVVVFAVGGLTGRLRKSGTPLTLLLGALFLALGAAILWIFGS